MLPEPEKLYPFTSPEIQALFVAGPNFFRRQLVPDTCFTQRGFEIGEGWYPLAQRLAERVEALLVEVDEPTRQEVKCTQIKDKFGELRVYYRAPATLRAAINAAIEPAITESRQTCERCGAPGRRVSPADWILVVCEPHLQEYVVRRNITLDGPLPDADDD